ncbi:amidohydrolase family protein [bacterium]|nr:amidohydrolase family protein [bacterium]NUP92444.1 amidohydrolase family protein [Candidatus Omnitrophota bacterium]
MNRFEKPPRSYASDLERAVFETPLADTHEHLFYEKAWIESKCDVLRDLLNNYVEADLRVAGADRQAIERALNAEDPDIEGRLTGILPALEKSRFTGYGEMVYLLARVVYGIEELTADALKNAQPILDGLMQPGERLRLLRDVAGLDHAQTDDFVWACLPDSSGPDFFFYDLSWWNFCQGEIQAEKIHAEVGIEVSSLSSLDNAMEAIFEKYSRCAIAVKTQHAYNRTLSWSERDRADVEIALNKALTHPAESLSVEDRLCLGDWCLARGVEIATKQDLPFKIHTGYYAGTSSMRNNRIKPSNLCDLLVKYPKARFVLMHIGYPYNDEMVSLAKHFPNVTVDLCWAWEIDPYSTKDFLRRMLHAAPVNRLFAFGGDTRHPTCAYAYSIQARIWLNRTLNEEVREGYLTEKQAIQVAQAWMCGNQREYFRLGQKRKGIASWTGECL